MNWREPLPPSVERSGELLSRCVWRLVRLSFTLQDLSAKMLREAGGVVGEGPGLRGFRSILDIGVTNSEMVPRVPTAAADRSANLGMIAPYFGQY